MTPVRLLAARDDNVPAVSVFLKRLEAALSLAQQNIRKAQQQQATQANRHRRDLSFSVGDSVLLATDHLRRHDTAGYKLRGRFCGPFQILKVVGPNAYELDLPPSWRIHPVQNISKLRVYEDPTVHFPSRSPAPPPPLAPFADSSEPRWELDSLLGKRRVGKGRRATWEVKIRWTNCPPSDDSWQPLSNLNPAALTWAKKQLPSLPILSVLAV
jgi:hypothetical protein